MRVFISANIRDFGNCDHFAPFFNKIFAKRKFKLAHFNKILENRGLGRDFMTNFK